MDKEIKTVNEYISGFPKSTQKILHQVRRTILEVAPDAVEVMSYGIPTFDLNKKHLIHFAGYEHHIGLYPGPQALEFFQDEIKSYKTSKGTVQFPIDKPMPIELIQKITKFRVDQIAK
jgi:uncharacterized protein YdhG (YjbR/CyaY superfamily)